MSRDYGVPQYDKHDLAMEFPVQRTTRCRTCKMWNGHDVMCPDGNDEDADDTTEGEEP